MSDKPEPDQNEISWADLQAIFDGDEEIGPLFVANADEAKLKQAQVKK